MLNCALARDFTWSLEIGAHRLPRWCLSPAEAKATPGNRHNGADQWLYVVSGAGLASVNGKRVPLRAGVLLLIEQNDRHEIKNTGRGWLRTLNYYSPPAYTEGGEDLPAARRS
jgi:mannose-6-phosphate isomerase-like protein (cupin superfamily)